jgi:hypothetical protein
MLPSPKAPQTKDWPLQESVISYIYSRVSWIQFRLKVVHYPQWQIFPSLTMSRAEQLDICLEHIKEDLKRFDLNLSIISELDDTEEASALKQHLMVLRGRLAGPRAYWKDKYAHYKITAKQFEGKLQNNPRAMQCEELFHFLGAAYTLFAQAKFRHGTRGVQDVGTAILSILNDAESELDVSQHKDFALAHNRMQECLNFIRSQWAIVLLELKVVPLFEISASNAFQLFLEDKKLDLLPVPDEDGSVTITVPGSLYSMSDDHGAEGTSHASEPPGSATVSSHRTAVASARARMRTTYSSRGDFDPSGKPRRGARISSWSILRERTAWCAGSSAGEVDN